MARHRRRRRRYRKISTAENITFYAIMVLLVVGGMAHVLVTYSNILVQGAVYAAWLVLVVVMCLALFRVARYVWQSNKRNRYFASLDAEMAYKYVKPFEFENYVASIFKRYGYATKVTRRSGDHGIDIIMHREGKKYAVQVKRYRLRNAVKEREVREFHGSIAGKGYAHGYFVTSGRFTQYAREWTQDVPLISLIDGAAFMDYVDRSTMNHTVMTHLVDMLLGRKGL